MPTRRASPSPSRCSEPDCSNEATPRTSDSPVQWVFDRTTPAGLRDGQYLAISLSGADEIVDEPVERLRKVFLPALADLFPAARTATVRRFLVTRERAATFRQAPGTAPSRLPAQ